MVPARAPRVYLHLGAVVLGAVAISVPNAPGSWGTIGGALSVLVGIVYLLDLANEFRQRRHRATLLAGPQEA